ncbi:hypothetical protein CDL15_Pgr015636 [Punica granatum]|uniref:Uncharacterized protein n=1 Tax=Punica granatum TaxID=22663 RepID=A0A218XQ22_PUNGR|nr:hypothetical protein CDL15_Pgr015636 [Punica granatum]PKI67171.1 hypothetical protein CRG98_012420 [Punica granatum]
MSATRFEVEEVRWIKRQRMVADRVEGSVRRRSPGSLDLGSGGKGLVVSCTAKVGNLTLKKRFNFGGCATRKLRKADTSKKSKGGLNWSEAIVLNEVKPGKGCDRVGEWRLTIAVLG